MEANGPTRRTPVMVAVAGDSAAGKTTLSRGLVAALGEDRTVSICVDDYHRYDREERKGLAFTPLHPDCNYVGIMDQHLRLLARGEPILKPVYDHDSGRLGRPELVEAGRDFVIIEGLLPLHSRPARSSFDVSVYLDPPEGVRRAWKIKRDTTKRGYTAEHVLAELARRESESAAFIRPQKAHADLVVSFAPIEARGESPHSPSATIVLRPTVPHPNLAGIITEDVRQVIHLKLTRDEDGRPVDAIHIHGYAPPEVTRPIEEAIWDQLGADRPLPGGLGMVEPGVRSDALALVQLILLYHLLQARGEAIPSVATAGAVTT